MKALALINETAGTVDKAGVETIAETIASGAREAGWALESETGPADALVERARAADGFDAVICAGGDGTQAAVAGALDGKRTALLPLPCGTVNLFCRDIGLPMDIAEALAAGLSARPIALDLGMIEADGLGERAFLNNIVFGAYADLAEARESMREAETLDDLSFAVVQAADALANAGPSEYRLALDGEERVFRTNTLIISNNAFSGSIDFLPRRERLDAGALAVYLVAAEGGAAFTRRLIDFLTGSADESEKVELAPCRRCVVRIGEGPAVYAVDGDPMESEGPIRMSLRPRALRVLAPAYNAG